MNTPICDFLDRYAAGKAARFHMPGHKGRNSGVTSRAGNDETDGRTPPGRTAGEDAFRHPQTCENLPERGENPGTGFTAVVSDGSAGSAMVTSGRGAGSATVASNEDAGSVAASDRSAGSVIVTSDEGVSSVAVASGWSTGAERYDITEIEGADSLYEATGIIRESEKNAGSLFGAETFYSTEGSSLAIRAMLYLVCLYAKERGEQPWIAAGRNAHRTFIGAAALLGIEVDWLVPPGSTYLSCPVTGDAVRTYLDRAEKLPTAVYLTSPDYTGRLADVQGVAEICREKGVLLLVDNAHGAYLKFLSQSRHPMDLGADLCCDSAHKTLPALTGGAYLHVSRNAPGLFCRRAKEALALFGSTSPSYLILASLDALNPYLAEGFGADLRRMTERLDRMKRILAEQGIPLVGEEPMKLTVAAKPLGYTGDRLAAYLAGQGIVAEFCDPDAVVLMPSVRTEEEELERLCHALLSLPRHAPINEMPPDISLPKRVLSPRQALFAQEELLPAEQCVGRVAASVTVGCPPAVPVVIPGERIDDAAIRCLTYYGIRQCAVVRE